MVGARGMMRPYPFGRMVRDLTMYLRQPAPDAVIERIGRHVLDDTAGRRCGAMWPSGRRKKPLLNCFSLLCLQPPRRPAQPHARLFRGRVPRQPGPVEFHFQSVRDRQVRRDPRRAAASALCLGVRGGLLHRRSDGPTRPPLRTIALHRRVRTGAPGRARTLRRAGQHSLRATDPAGRIPGRSIRSDRGFRSRLLPGDARPVENARTGRQPTRAGRATPAGALDASGP